MLKKKPSAILRLLSDFEWKQPISLQMPPPQLACAGKKQTGCEWAEMVDCWRTRFHSETAWGKDFFRKRVRFGYDVAGQVFKLCFGLDSRCTSAFSICFTQLRSPGLSRFTESVKTVPSGLSKTKPIIWLLNKAHNVVISSSMGFLPKYQNLLRN